MPILSSDSSHLLHLVILVNITNRLHIFVGSIHSMIEILVMETNLTHCVDILEANT